MSLLIDTALLAMYYIVLLTLSIYGLHRFHLVRVRRRYPSLPVSVALGPEIWPDVTVQLPLYNEPNVVERLLAAAAALEYPGNLEVQILDDSTDQTSNLVTHLIEELSSSGRGIDMVHLRRTNRSGYKAGALAAGLTTARGEFIAIFDADFVPPRDILTTLIPHFTDPRVGMVQARWSHLNRNHSMLTRVQAIYLDGHFAVESAARWLDRRFFNFNGTAGVWRKQAILDAGGWSASTLTEDLDLSYRAQLAGWRFVCVPGDEVPAELPSNLSGFQLQQHRWARGSIQTARKLLPRVLASRSLPRRVKVEAFFHLTNNCAYLLTLCAALLLIPALGVRAEHRIDWLVVLDLILFVASTCSVLLFYAEGQKLVGGRLGWKEILAVVPFGIGVSVRNAAAVLEGMMLSAGHFSRTPKKGQGTIESSSERPPRFPLPELLLVLLMSIAAVSLLIDGAIGALPVVLLFLGGFASTGILGLTEFASAFRAPASPPSEIAKPQAACAAEAS